MIEHFIWWLAAQTSFLVAAIIPVALYMLALSAISSESVLINVLSPLVPGIFTYLFPILAAVQLPSFAWLPGVAPSNAPAKTS